MSSGQNKKTKAEPSFVAQSAKNKINKRRDKAKEKLRKKNENIDPLPLLGKSFYLFGPENGLRKALK